MIEGDKVKKVTGTRRIGRLTPTGFPPLAWQVSPFKSKCQNGLTYPYIPELTNREVWASVSSKTSLYVSAKGVSAGAAVKWTINPKQAKRISPDIQHGKPEDFNQILCKKISFSETGWTFPRRRNTVKTVLDDFNHLQVLYVTQKATAMGQPPAGSTGQKPSSSHFKGDRNP